MKQTTIFNDVDSTHCPKCKSIDLDLVDDYKGKCLTCGLEYDIATAFIWEDGKPEPPKEVKIRQADIEISGHKYTVTHIPTATSGGWYTIQDACELWGAVAIDFDGSVIGWREAPREEIREEVEKAIKKAFAEDFQP